MKSLLPISALVVAATLAIGEPTSATVADDVDACNRLTGPENARAAVLVCSQALNSGLISDPVRVGMLVNRGNAYSVLGQFEAAIRDLSDALAIGGPRAFEAWYGRGLARSGIGDLDKAIVDFDRALEIDGEAAPVFVARGNAFAAKGEYARAIEDYDSAIALDAGLADAWYARGTINNRLGNADQAIADFEQAMQIGGAGTVVALQTYLAAFGLYTGELDGTYGPGTQEALKACVNDPRC